jgi:hypothetical protein
MQWEEIKGVKERIQRLDEQMAALHLKEEEIGVQMATLSLKERELDSCLIETREFTERLSQLVVRVVQGFMQQTQELSLIKFLLSTVLFRAGRRPGSGGSNELHVPPRGPRSGVPLPPAPQSSLVGWIPPLELPLPSFLSQAPYTVH